MSQHSDSRLRLRWAEADGHRLHELCHSSWRRWAPWCLRGAQSAAVAVFRPEHRTFQTASANWSPSRRRWAESQGSVKEAKCGTVEEDGPAPLRLENLGLGTTQETGCTWSSFSRGICPTLPVRCRPALVCIPRIRKPALRKSPSLRFHNSSGTRWNLNPGPNWSSPSYITLPSSERESSTLHEPTGRRGAEVTQRPGLHRRRCFLGTCVLCNGGRGTLCRGSCGGILPVGGGWTWALKIPSVFAQFSACIPWRVTTYAELVCSKFCERHTNGREVSRNKPAYLWSIDFWQGYQRNRKHDRIPYLVSGQLWQMSLPLPHPS